MSRYNAVQLMTGDVPDGWIEEVIDGRDLDGFYIGKLSKKYNKDKSFRKLVNLYAGVDMRYNADKFIKLGDLLMKFSMFESMLHIIKFMSAGERGLFLEKYEKYLEDLSPDSSKKYQETFISIKNAAALGLKDDDEDEETDFLSGLTF